MSTLRALGSSIAPYFWPFTRRGQSYIHIDDENDDNEPRLQEKPLSETAQRNARPSSGCVVRIVTFAVFTLIGAILGASLTWLLKHTPKCPMGQVETDTHLSILPDVSFGTPVLFQPDYRYWNITDYNSEQTWRALGRHGGINIKDPSRFGLSPGIEQDSDYEHFPISVFHQLHCLGTVRQHYSLLLQGFTSPDTIQDHVDHCFDYLRQAIMCNGDLSVEAAKVDEDGHRRVTEGWGTTHNCKSWKDILSVKEEYTWKHAFE